MSRGLDLTDFLDQMKKVKKMGSMRQLLKMMPGLSGQLDGMDIDDGELVRFEAIIHSMTPAERSNPSIINSSRKKRIAKGSGTDVQEVNQLMKQFNQMSKMMKMMQGGGGKQLMQMMKGM
jgi:signal recognition particle subunit SRP54